MFYDINDETSIGFPYYKKINNVIHTFLYLIHNKNNTCDLIHYYYDEKWHKYLLDTSEFYILSNFCIVPASNAIAIYYLKKINDCEEIFKIYFNCNSKNYTKPIQITNNHKSKVYLSTIYYDNTVHLCFAEKNNDKYFCSYMNEDDNKIVHISQNLLCEFPHFIQKNHTLFITWREYNQIFTEALT